MSSEYNEAKKAEHGLKFKGALVNFNVSNLDELVLKVCKILASNIVDDYFNKLNVDNSVSQRYNLPTVDDH